MEAWLGEHDDIRAFDSFALALSITEKLIADDICNLRCK